VGQFQRTDYKRVAARYDEDRRGYQSTRDDFLAERLALEPERPFTVLDLGCGTGTYLKMQATQFAGETLRLVGVDPSAAMLEHARKKSIEAPLSIELREGAAERIPLPDDVVHLIVSNVSFHHFSDKHRALDEIGRVARTQAALTIATLDVGAMADWWVYRFFPETVAADRVRFWTVDRLRAELDKRGWSVSFDIRHSHDERSVARQLETALRRTTSQLDILDDPDYERGLQRMRKLLADDPNATIDSEFALVVCRGWRG
jgi:ubiquinone/menaquinone biosynthesis C-methylase UbiE